MYESLFLVPDIDKGSIERGKDLLDLSQIDIAYRKTVPFAGLLVQFDQPVILHQGDLNLCRLHIDNQVFFGFFRLHT